MRKHPPAPAAIAVHALNMVVKEYVPELGSVMRRYNPLDAERVIDCGSYVLFFDSADRRAAQVSAYFEEGAELCHAVVAIIDVYGLARDGKELPSEAFDKEKTYEITVKLDDVPRMRTYGEPQMHHKSYKPRVIRAFKPWRE